MCSCLRGVSRWFTPLACGPGYPELSKSYMGMASKLFTFTFTFTRCGALLRPVASHARHRDAAMTADRAVIRKPALVQHGRCRGGSWRRATWPVTARAARHGRADGAEPDAMRAYAPVKHGHIVMQGP